MSNKQETIYITLDCILDTRIATLYSINEDIAKKVLMSETYHSRDEDKFENIDKKTFRESYEKRNAFTLTQSLMTNVFALLINLITAMRKEAIKKPYYSGTKLVVDYHPYDLTGEEITLLSKAIAFKLGGSVNVSMVKYTLNDITPKFCKDNFNIMIMYDYADWLNVNAELFVKTQIPEIPLFVPALFFNEKPDADQMKKIVSDSMHPMLAMETLSSPLVGLTLIDVKYFSILNEAGI